MYNEILQQLGLSPAEAKIYLVLLDDGEQGAAELVEKTGLGRGNTYNGLVALEKHGLAEALPGKKNLYRATNPEKLTTLLEKKRRTEHERMETIRAAIPELVSRFVSTTEKPVVWSSEGIDAVKAAYSDILANAKEILIFPSSFDRVLPALDALIDKNIALQQERGITSRILVGQKDNDLPESFAALAKKSITCRVIPADNLDLKSQILIWNNKVVINTLKTDISVVILEHPDIAQSLRAIFETFWALGKDPISAKE